MANVSVEVLASGVIAGDRRALAKAITLVESSRAEDRKARDALISALTPRAGQAYRVGVTGTPGAGKSTFIEAFGLHLIAQGQRVAVLSIDPSSVKTGGSILGDKTRMQRLATHDRAYVRPSPSGKARGGVARATPEAVLLCEAAGYDTVIVETVGVGQAEYAVRYVVDFILLLASPGAGDELQGIKRGILEIVDCVAINKADGELVELAEQAAAEYRSALQLFRGRDAPAVLAISALKARGVDQIWTLIEAQRRDLASSGELERRRGEQRQSLFWELLSDALVYELLQNPAVVQQKASLLQALYAGKLTPDGAVTKMIDLMKSE